MAPGFVRCGSFVSFGPRGGLIQGQERGRPNGKGNRATRRIRVDWGGVRSAHKSLTTSRAWVGAGLWGQGQEFARPIDIGSRRSKVQTPSRQAGLKGFVAVDRTDRNGLQMVGLNGRLRTNYSFRSPFSRGSEHMGYYIRFFSTSNDEITLSKIETALKQADSAYAITDKTSGRREGGILTYEGGVYGQIEIDRPGDGLFGEDLEELKEEAEEAHGKGKNTVLKALGAAKAIVAIDLLFQDRETEVTLRKIDPVWVWLFENRSGLLQVDGEGWYDHSRQILRSD